MMEFLNEIEYALTHPNLSFFLGAILAFLTDSLIHFTGRIIRHYIALGKEDVNDNDVP